MSIDFTIDDIRDGFHFVGCDPDDPRYPHAYTTNSPIPGSACCLFPCIDDIHERYTWDIEVTVPRTLGDIRRVIPESALTNGAYGVNGVHRDDLPLDDDDEANDMDMIVVCSGDFTDEVRQSLRWNSSEQMLT